LKLLGIGWTDGDNHPSAVAELREECGRNFESRSGDKDCIEGSIRGKAKRAITGKYFDIPVTEPGDGRTSISSEVGVTFDGKHLCGEFR